MKVQENRNGTEFSRPVGGGAVVPSVEEKVEERVELDAKWVVVSVLVEVEVVLALVVRVVSDVLLTVEVMRRVDRIEVLTVVGTVE